MKRDTLIGTIAILIIIVGLTFYFVTKSQPTKTPTIPLASTADSFPAGGYTEHAKYYDSAVNYATSTPLLSSVGASADAQAVAVMQKFASDTVAQFKIDGNFANLTANDTKMMGFDQGRKETLKIVYLIASSPHTVSYIYTIYEDTLGAHGNIFFKTFTFDTSTGAPLALADIFTSGSSYLDLLSKISRAKLPSVIGKNADTLFITNGTAPKDKNFANFFFDNHDLVILFAPYAVAPYSSGPQTLRIPFTAFSSILKPEYR